MLKVKMLLCFKQFKALPWRYSLIGKTVDSYFTITGSIPVVSILKGAAGIARKVSLYTYNSFGQIYFLFISIRLTLALNPIIVEGFSESNIDEYYSTLFWTIWYTSAVCIPVKLLNDFLVETQEELLAQFDATKPTSSKWLKLNLQNDLRPWNSWTNSCSIQLGICWVKVVAPVATSLNMKQLIELPASLATEGVFVDLVGALASEDRYTIVAAVSRLVILYYSGWSKLASKEDLIFFFKTATINFSPAATAYLSEWSQRVLLLHFNTKYGELAFKSLDYKNPIVEFAQLWILTHDLPYLENS